MNEREARKRRAAERAVEFVEDAMTLGLGTGSTAGHVLDVLAEARRAGGLADIVGVPTSRATERRAGELEIPLSTLDEAGRVDLTLDGADEVSPELDLIKGLGGALLHEKIVACASERLVIVVDDGKRVERLGRAAPLPVEVVPFAWSTHLPFLRDLGADPGLRTTAAGEPYRTDGGHYIIDCAFPRGLEDPAHVDRMLRRRVGLVETGLFVGMADVVVVGEESGVEVLWKETAAAWM